MLSKLAVLAIAGTMLLSSHSKASDSNGAYHVHAVFPCASYLQARQDEVQARARIQRPMQDVTYSLSMSAAHNYIMGFISAYNLATPNVYNVLAFDAQTIWLLVENACKTNPTFDLSQSVGVVILVNARNWQRKAP
jgi:hypothetical protein